MVISIAPTPLLWEQMENYTEHLHPTSSLALCPCTALSGGARIAHIVAVFWSAGCAVAGALTHAQCNVPGQCHGALYESWPGGEGLWPGPEYGGGETTEEGAGGGHGG